MCSSLQADKSDFSTDMCAADSTYQKWKEVPLAEGSNPKDYFIVDYLRERSRYSEAADIYEGLVGRIRKQSDTLGNMMLFAKWGLEEVMEKMGGIPPGIRHLCRSAGDKRHSAGSSGSRRCSRTCGTL